MNPTEGQKLENYGIRKMELSGELAVLPTRVWVRVQEDRRSSVLQATSIPKLTHFQNMACFVGIV